MPITSGLRGRSETTVTLDNTALAAGSGSLPVFGTPFMAALMEAAAVDALKLALAADETSVGTKLELTHDAPTPLGMRVWAQAEVTQVEGRAVTLLVHAFDEAGQIGSCLHQRFVVVGEKFMAKAARRKEG